MGRLGAIFFSVSSVHGRLMMREVIHAECCFNCRDVPFSAFYWMVLENVRDSATRLYEGRGLRIGETEDGERNALSSSELVLLNLSCGIFAGSAAALLTTPGDVIYVQTVADQGGARGNAVITAQRLWAQEGIAGFFRGWQPRAIKVAPACGIVIASYELFKRLVRF